MQAEVLKSKINRAKVTQEELHYVGSIILDQNLMKASNIMAREQVHIVNINNGERLETFVIPGEAKEFKPTLLFPNSNNMPV